MRLAVFTSQFPGRVSTFFSRDIRGLLEAGLDIDVFAIYPYKTELWRYVPDILNETQLSRRKVHHAGPMQMLRYARPRPPVKLGKFLRHTAAIAISAARFGPLSVAKTLYVIMQAWTWAQQYAGNYDHVLAYWANYSGTCAYLFHRLIDRPIPFSIYPHAGVDLYRNQIYLRQKLLYADNIIVDCEFNKRFIERLYPDIFHLLADRIHLYHPGVDLVEFSCQLDGRSSRKVIAVGRLVRTKGFDYLLRAAQELKRRNTNVEVEIVGDGEEAHSLQTLARNLGIQDTVKFRGWLTSENVRKAVREATILVHPSSDLDDAVPNVIKEAMALGTPVVAASVAGIPELLDGGRCGLLVPPKDVLALAGGIQTLLADGITRQQLARSARMHAEGKFDLWRNGPRLADLLRSTRRLNPLK